MSEPVKENKPMYLEMEFISLHDTAKLMASQFYEDRFVAEYVQLKIRYEKLKALLTKWEAFNKTDCSAVTVTLPGSKSYTEKLTDHLGFTPSCPFDLLREQQHTMGLYLHQLEIRSCMENINLLGFTIKL